MLRLRYLTANAAWVFTYGDDIIRMGDGPMFHDSRADAVRAAGACRLQVDAHGVVTCEEERVL